MTHPVAVTEILADMQLDADALIAGLLHDTVEDTEVTLADVETRFGEPVRRIVEGETKISKLKISRLGNAYEDEQAENLRQMLLAMVGDVRIILVKFADRLHNMRTLNFMPPEKQKRIARETLEIFAPLAHRLGINHIKSELEELGFFVPRARPLPHFRTPGTAPPRRTRGVCGALYRDVRRPAGARRVVVRDRGAE